MKAVADLRIESELVHLCRGIKDNRSQEELDKTLVTKIFVNLYAIGEEYGSLNALRARVYYGEHNYLEALRRIDDAQLYHALRAVFQTYIWVLALDPKPDILDPFKFGWTC